MDGGHDWPGYSSFEIWNFFSQYAFILGDLNGDDIVNVLDVIQVVNLILSNAYEQNGNLNQDEVINVLDVIQLVNIILN